MAPLTRGSVGGTPKVVQREGSWQFPTVNEAQDSVEEDSGASGSEQDPFDEDQDMTMESPTPSLRTNDPLPALQRTAERVSRQVEEFARSLDQFCGRKIEPTETESWEHARQLVKNYQSSADRRMKNVTQSSGFSRTRNLDSLSSVEIEELHSCELEVDTWDLLYELFEVQDPASQAELRKLESKPFHKLHRYSTNGEVWEAFIECDASAQEYLTILTWLQKTAARTRPPIEEMVQKLASRELSTPYTGVWPAGWLVTKLAIKRAKRMQAIPAPLDPKVPGIEAALTNDEVNGPPLVTQLDPDAITRQKRGLHKDDRFHEKASWLACWEMLRRGYNYSAVEEWWKERKESWRAAAILGASLHPEATNPADAGISWMISLPQKVRNRAMAKLSAADLKLDKYEAAVCGLLCSQLEATWEICETVDDYLFVFFSNALLQSYHRFCDGYHEKAFQGIHPKFLPAPSQFKEVDRLLAEVQGRPETREETRVPLKVVEAAIITKRYHAFFIRMGTALSMLAMMNGGSPLIYSDDQAVTDESALAAAQNPEALRVAAHLLVLLKSLALVDFDGVDHEFAQNCIAGYVGVLREEAKMQLIPLYVAQLSPHRMALTLASVLIDVTDPSEREMQIKLMGKYGIDIAAVLWKVFEINFPVEGEKEQAFTPVHILEYIGEGKSRTLRIKAGFLDDDLTNEEELLIRCLEWYQYVDFTQWQQCCLVGSLLYKYFIFNGRLAAARALLSRAPLSSISLQATKMDLSLPDSVEVSEDEYEGEPDGIPAEERSKSISPSKYPKYRARSPSRATFQRTYAEFRLQAQTWRELEQLVGILDALEEWSAVAEDAERYREDTKQIASSKRALAKSLDLVKESTYPIFSPTFLNLPLTPDEAEPLSKIRTFYLPEIILAYNSVLLFAGRALTRDHLTECMDLATEVATISELSDVFMAAGRMRQFVEQCAMSAKTLLIANESGSSKSKKKKPGVAGNNEIWQVKATSQSLLEQLPKKEQTL